VNLISVGTKRVLVDEIPYPSKITATEQQVYADVFIHVKN